MIDRTPISQIVARKIHEKIKSGAFLVSERLPSQRKLAEELGVSRSSLREALMTLETLGLIKTTVGSGTVVCEPQGSVAPITDHWRYSDHYSVKDVFEIRMIYEGRLARHAAQTATVDDISVLTTATNKMEAAWSKGDLIENVEEDLKFHRHIASKSKNALLYQHYQSIADLLTETQRQPIPYTALNRMADSIAEHRTFIDALHARNSDAAEQAMVAHIRNTAKCGGIDL
jgi:GntR family transcriptional repressor for pyruvate dehydrogenase complex